MTLHMELEDEKLASIIFHKFKEDGCMIDTFDANKPKAKKMPFMQSDRNFRKEWMKKHKNDRTDAWRKRCEENPLNALLGFEQ